MDSGIISDFSRALSNLKILRSAGLPLKSPFWPNQQKKGTEKNVVKFQIVNPSTSSQAKNPTAFSEIHFNQPTHHLPTGSEKTGACMKFVTAEPKATAIKILAPEVVRVGGLDGRSGEAPLSH